MRIICTSLFPSQPLEPASHLIWGTALAQCLMPQGTEISLARGAAQKPVSDGAEL
jgi:hypothetical protein